MEEGKTKDEIGMRARNIRKEGRSFDNGGKGERREKDGMKKKTKGLRQE